MERKLKEIIFDLIYNRKGKLNKQGKALIQIRAYQKGKSRYISTDIYVKPNQWNKRLKEVKAHPNKLKSNRHIYEQLRTLESMEVDIINHKGYCTLDDLLNHRVSQMRYTSSFIEFWEDELNSVQGQKTEETIQSYRNTLNKLKEFRAPIHFRDLTYNFIVNFDNYLFSLGSIGVTTVAKYHKEVRAMVNSAIKKDLFDINNNPYKKFKPKIEKGAPKTYLTLKEIERIAALTFEEDEEEISVFRDMFLFGCYTGLRSSDLLTLQKKHILETERGCFLKKKAYKTGKLIRLPLYNLFPKGDHELSLPEVLIDKYFIELERNYFGVDKTEQLVFPEFEAGKKKKRVAEIEVNIKSRNQRHNALLKIIQERAGIKTNLTTHLARHSFGTHLATKVSPFVLKNLMQHSKMEMTMDYVHISKEIIDNELDNVIW